jgi:ATP-dependent Clp protease ATP-binding subunit ClpB
MNIEKMTTNLQQALAEAQKIAQIRQHQMIEIVHLWKFLIQPGQFAHDF